MENFHTILKNMVEEIVTEVGLGYSECIYKNALKVLFRNNSIPYQEEVVKIVKFKNEQIGTVRLDLIVDMGFTPELREHKIIIELKALQKITDKEINQVQRYKKLTGINEAYIINFSLKNYTIDCVWVIGFLIFPNAVIRVCIKVFWSDAGVVVPPVLGVVTVLVV